MIFYIDWRLRLVVNKEIWILVDRLNWLALSNWLWLDCEFKIFLILFNLNIVYSRFGLLSSLSGLCISLKSALSISGLLVSIPSIGTSSTVSSQFLGSLFVFMNEHCNSNTDCNNQD